MGAAMDESRLKLAVQKSGRLTEPSLDMLARCGLKLSRGKDQLMGYGENMPLDVLFVRDDDIPDLVQEDVCDLGLVGLNVLECDDPELHEVACDQLVTIFRKAYERFWGPRTDDILRAAVLTLLLRPGSSLCEVPLLLLQPEARKVFTSDLRDPIGLGPFWNEYEQMADGQRLQMVGPVLNKLRSVLLRRTVRNIMGQPRSTIDLAACMEQGGILLVSLAKGLLGEETSRLLGAFLVARIWQTAMARAARPQS